MIRKAFALFAAILVFTLSSAAQQKNGRWTVYPTVGDTFSQVVENSDGVYAFTGNSLLHYGFDDNESYNFSTSDKLSERGAITKVLYNKAKGYLFVAYASGNIDLVYDNGKVVNLPEIRDAVLMGERTINDAIFVDGRIYIATAFGFVIYDDLRHEVVESGIFNKNVNHIFVQDGQLLIRIDNDLYKSPLEGIHSNFDKFELVCKLWATYGLEWLGRTTLISCHGDGTFITEINIANNRIDRRKVSTLHNPVLLRGSEGAMFSDNVNYYFIDIDGNVTTKPIPEALKASVPRGAASVSSVWVETDGVLGRYDLSKDTPTQLLNLAKPEGFSMSEVTYMKWSAGNSRLYVSEPSNTSIYADPGDNYDKPQHTDAIVGGKIIDVAVKDASRYASKVDFQHNNGRVSGTNRFVTDNDDPELYFISSNISGVHAVKNGDILDSYNKDNTPWPDGWWLHRAMDVNMDADGNLWIVAGYAKGNARTLLILPANKVHQYGKITKDDWVSITADKILNDGYMFDRDAGSMFCKKSRYKFYKVGARDFGFLAYDDNGTPLRLADDKSHHYQSVTDTEGNSLKQIFNYDITEDQNGQVWFGTDRGVFYIANPADALSNDLRVKRPIVPRNDGTNYGDYLLETENVYAIAVDPSNRKWLGSSTSGAYLVSADGTKILAHYTTENSPLPSNSVWAIACDPNSNRVYFATPNGMVSFNSDSSPAADDYSEVYAYPNPVRPDYTGWITIAGLMDDSLVKIADISGNVFFTGRSEGGMVAWDGCDADGRRVKTGVYLVFASQNASGSSSGAVAKIMVVN